MNDFTDEVAGRFGLLPNFFRSAPAAPGLVEELWAFARSAYLDSPLPALFKERLFVHLSRFCEVRYCVVRHVGFLIGQGHPAGDPDALPETVEQAVALLGRPIPGAAALDAALSRLEANGQPAALPKPRTQAEADLFDALAVVFVEPRQAARARDAVRRAVGEARLEILLAFLAFIRTAHYWTETHPDLAIEPDMEAVMDRFGDLARLLDPLHAEPVQARRRLRRTLDELHHTQDALHESEERLRALVTATSYAIYRMSPDWSEMRQLDGQGFLSDTKHPSRAWLDEYIHPDDQPRVRHAIQKAIQTKGMFELEHRVRQPDGSLGWTLSRAVPLLDVRGEIREWFGAASDVTARRRTEDALRGSEARMRALVEGISQLVWRTDGDGLLNWISPQWAAFTGRTEQSGHGHGWLQAVHPGDRTLLLDAWHGARAGGAFRVDHRLWCAAEGRYRWVQSQALPVRSSADADHGDGRAAEWLGTTTDVEELRRAHEQRVLIEELHHRGRNLLAVIAGIAEQTLATCGSLEEFGARFEQRLGALGRVQGLLSREAAAGATVIELLQLELTAHGADKDDRIRLGGPDLALPAQAVQLLSLTLHELLTNARKHGALGAAGGRLDVAWGERRDATGHRRLWLDWAESGVSVPRNAEARHRGFGLDLIEQILPYELDAETKFAFRPGGVRCTIELPLDDGPATGTAPDA